MTNTDVLVVGAGIVGACVARDCARAGLRVAVVEAGVVGGATTAAGMGHVVVMDDSPAQLALTALSRRLWQQEEPSLDPTGDRAANRSVNRSVEYDARGTLWVAADAEEMAEVEAKCRSFAAAGVRSMVLNAEDLARAEPNLRRDLAGGLLVPDDAVLYPPGAARLFLDQAVQAGACVHQARVVAAAHGEARLSNGQNLTAHSLVLATGADCTLLPALPMEKRKGHLALTDRYPDFCRHQLLEMGYLKSAHSVQGDSVAFNIQPRRTGQLLIGSSRQYGRDDAACEPAMLRRMIARAVEYMPGLAGMSVIRTWTGFRAATPDKLPLLGPAGPLQEAAGETPDPSLWLAAGFEGLGITNAPAAGQLLAAQLLGRHPQVDPAPYLPARFAAAAAPAAAHA